MKLFIFGLFAIVLNTSMLFGQLEKGTIIVGVNGNFYSGLGGGNRVYGLQLQPTGGYFVAKKFALGVELAIQTVGQRIEGNSSNDFRFSGTSISPFARYYFLRSDARFNIFGQAGLTFGGSWGGLNGNDISNFQISPNLKLGAAYFLSKNIALELMVNYNPQKITGFDQYSNVSGTLGFQIHLNSRVKSNPSSVSLKR